MSGAPGAVTALPLDAMFDAANSLALACWIVLAVAPRGPRTFALLRVPIVLLLCPAYAVLIMAAFFEVPGGGFGSLPAVQRLFVVPEVALAGWLHYLAFDLFVGLWIARRADALGVGRLLQLPVLTGTFMFGPIGLLLFAAIHGLRTVVGGRLPHAPMAVAT